MEFQRCSIGGIAYGEGVTEAMKGAQIREASGTGETSPGAGPGGAEEDLPGKLASMKTQMIGIMERTFKNRYLQQDRLTLVSPKLAEDMSERGSKQKGRIVAFFKALALCHSVLADRPSGAGAGADPKDPDAFRLEYKAESPDEAALVGAARDVGFPFLSKGKEFVEVEVMGQLEKYALLKTLEFNSTRKRMSTIYRCPDGRIVLYTKGADSVIYARLSPEQDPYLKEKTAKDMELFANSGLRTLCVAHRYLSEEEFLSWERGYDRASAATENRDEEIEKSCEEMERGLEILGATALEDKLQEGVPEAIEMLHRAGIKLWILTGRFFFWFLIFLLILICV
jgi:phospholipid-translocating ATPase